MTKQEIAWLSIRSAGIILIIIGLNGLFMAAAVTWSTHSMLSLTDQLNNEDAAQIRQESRTSMARTFVTVGSYAGTNIISGMYLLFGGRFVFRLITRDKTTESETQ